jgi:hypothetical protein
MAGLEVLLLREGGVRIASALFVSAAMALWLARKLKVRRVEEISYDVEVPDEMFQGFNLTETYAAQSVAPRANGSSKFTV